MFNKQKFLELVEKEPSDFLERFERLKKAWNEKGQDINSPKE